MGDHFGRRRCACIQTSSQLTAPAARGEEPGGEKVSCPGCIDHSVHGRRANFDAPSVLNGDRTFRTARDHQSSHLRRKHSKAVRKISAVRQVPHLMLIAEKHVYQSRIDHPEDALAATADAQAL